MTNLIPQICQLLHPISKSILLKISKKSNFLCIHYEHGIQNNIVPPIKFPGLGQGRLWWPMTHLPVEAFGELNPFQLREKKALEILWELFLQYKMKSHLHPNFNVHINVDLVSTKIGHIANEKLNSSMHYQVCMSKFFRLLIIIRCSKKVANKVMVYHWKYKIMKCLFYLHISTHYSSDVLGSKHFLSIFIAALAYLVKSAFTFNFGVVIFLTNGVISSKLHLSLVLNKTFNLSWILFGNLVSGKCRIWSLITRK